MSLPIVITVDDVKKHIIRDKELRNKLLNELEKLEKEGKTEKLTEGKLYRIYEDVYLTIENNKLIIYVEEEK